MPFKICKVFVHFSVLLWFSSDSCWVVLYLNLAIFHIRHSTMHLHLLCDVPKKERVANERGRAHDQGCDSEGEGGRRRGRRGIKMREGGDGGRRLAPRECICRYVW